MQFLACDQLAEIDRIFRNDYPILIQASREHLMVGFAQAAHVTGMYRVVLSRLVEMNGERWRQAFVDEQPQAAFAQGRPPGLPTSG